MERLSVGDHVYWESTAEPRAANPSTVDAIIKTTDGIEIRVVGPGGGEYTLDFPQNNHPKAHWHPSNESQEADRGANHQQRRGEIYVGRGPLMTLSLIGRAEDTPESMEHERVREVLD